MNQESSKQPAPARPALGEHAVARVALVMLALAVAMSLAFLWPDWREAPGLLLLILALAVRPNGVFGKATIRKV